MAIDQLNDRVPVIPASCCLAREATARAAREVSEDKVTSLGLSAESYVERASQYKANPKHIG